MQRSVRRHVPACDGTVVPAKSMMQPSFVTDHFLVHLTPELMYQPSLEPPNHFSDSHRAVIVGTDAYIEKVNDPEYFIHMGRTYSSLLNDRSATTLTVGFPSEAYYFGGQIRPAWFHAIEDKDSIWFVRDWYSERSSMWCLAVNATTLSGESFQLPHPSIVSEYVEKLPTPPQDEAEISEDTVIHLDCRRLFSDGARQLILLHYFRTSRGSAYGDNPTQVLLLFRCEDGQARVVGSIGPGKLVFDQYRAQFYARRGLEEHAAPPGIEQSDMFRIVRFRIGRSRIRPPVRWSIARSVKGACIQYRQINVTSMQSW